MSRLLDFSLFLTGVICVFRGYSIRRFRIFRMFQVCVGTRSQGSLNSKGVLTISDGGLRYDSCIGQGGSDFRREFSDRCMARAPGRVGEDSEALGNVFRYTVGTGEKCFVGGRCIVDVRVPMYAM